MHCGTQIKITHGSPHSVNVIKLKSDCSKSFSKDDFFFNKNNHLIIHVLRVVLYFRFLKAGL